jgi:hypothetical protein
MKSVGGHGSSALLLSMMEGDGLTLCEQLSQGDNLLFLSVLGMMRTTKNGYL